MINYEFVMPTQVYGGPGRSREIGEKLRGRTERVLLVYGGGSIKRNGLYDTVTKSLSENGIAWVELCGIRSNPTLQKVEEGIRICREQHISFLLAVGGGSVIDTAKGIAVGMPYEGSVWDFFMGKPIEAALPVACVLTIPGSGSETSANCVLTNEETQDKIGCYSNYFRPVLSILDPELCLTIPQSQIAPGVFDMLSHTMERYFTETTHTDIDDGVSEGVMRGIIKNGLAVMKDSRDLDAWGELMLGATLSHNWLTGIGRKQDWTNHAIEEVVSGFYDFLPHGAGLSIVTLAWMRYVYQRHIPMFVQFAVNVMGVRGELKHPERVALEGIEALERFCRDMKLPLHFSEVGIDDSRLEEMAKRCVALHGGTVGGLEQLGWEEIAEIYRMAR